MATTGEIVRVALHYVQPNAGDIMNVFYFKLTGTVGTDTALNNAVNEWVSGVWGYRWGLMAASSSNLSSYECDVVALDGTVTRNIGGGIVDLDGSVGGEVEAAGLCSYLLAYTAIPKARGSKYVPGISEAEHVSGSVSVGYLADLALLLGVYITAFTATTGEVLTPGIASRTLLQWVPFLVSGAIDTLLAYQRRRKEGVGI